MHHLIGILKPKSNGIFLILLLLIAFYYNYQEIAFYQPQSIHKWRQSDCAGIAMNYYLGGMDFFHPQVNNLTSKNGTSGLAYTSEMPLLYYGVAILYQLFGPHDYLYRILNTLIFLTGLFYLFRLAKILTGDVFWSAFVSLLFFSSPVLVYYGNNFLTNSSALAFSFIGWYYFVRFLKSKRAKWFYTAVIVFFLATSFKITAFFSFSAMGVLLIAEWSRLASFLNNEKYFSKPLLKLISIALAAIVVLGWALFAHIQNTKNGCNYFSTVTFPIWNLDKEGLSQVLKNIRLVWIPQYFHQSVLAFLGLLFIFLLSQFKKIPTMAKWVLTTLFIEVIVFILLQFWTFKDHDYYTIGLFIFPVLLLTTSLYFVKNYYPKVYTSWMLKIVFLIIRKYP